MDSWSISGLFGIFYGHLVYFAPFGMLYQDKFGNPAVNATFCDVWMFLQPLGQFFKERRGVKLAPT
jgi:hypothetical protein